MCPDLPVAGLNESANGLDGSLQDLFQGGSRFISMMGSLAMALTIYWTWGSSAW